MALNVNWIYLLAIGTMLILSLYAYRSINKHSRIKLFKNIVHAVESNDDKLLKFQLSRLFVESEAQLIQNQYTGNGPNIAFWSFMLEILNRHENNPNMLYGISLAALSLNDIQSNVRSSDPKSYFNLDGLIYLAGCGIKVEKNLALDDSELNDNFNKVINYFLKSCALQNSDNLYIPKFKSFLYNMSLEPWSKDYNLLLMDILYIARYLK